MKMVVAIIKPFKLEDVRENLTDLGIMGMTATDVKGYGQQDGQTDNYRGTDHRVAFLPKVKIEIVTDDKTVPKVIKAIEDAANTGRIGDGKIFVYDIEQVIRIRTGEKGDDAL